MKRFISMLLALVLVIGMLPLSVFAAELAITTQPKSVKVLEGQTAKVTLKATGDDLTYKWYYKNPGETKYTYTSSFKSNSYSITMNEARNGRYVYCKVYDGDGNYVKSNTVSLRMAEPVTITVQPEDVYVASGESAKVTVTAKGDGLTYQWYVKNPGKTTFSKSSITKSTYSVTMKDTVSGRQVYCIVTDKYGASAKSDTVTLSMGTPLKIVQQPVSVKVKSGDLATVTLTAEGDGLTYAWYYKNPGASKYSLTSSFKKNSYSVVMNADRDGRYVYCVVSDQYGNSVKSKTVSLRMEKDLSIAQQPQTVVCMPDETATFQVKAQYGTEPYTYQWQWQYVGMEEPEDLEDEDGISGTASDTLSIVAFVELFLEELDFRFRCVVTDAAGATVTSDWAGVQAEKPAIYYVDDAGCVELGEVASVKVYAMGQDLTYAWYYKDADDTDFTCTKSFKTDTYAVTLTKERVGRQVYCVVTDKNGNTAQTETVTLKLPDLWVSTQPKAANYTTAGSTVTLSTAVSGGAEPYTYRWEYSNNEVDYYTPVDAPFGRAEGYDTDTLTLTVSDADIQNGFRYRCVITDLMGTTVTTKDADILKPLTVTAQPEDVYKFQVTDNTASFTVNVEGGKGPYTYKWQFGSTDIDPATHTFVAESKAQTLVISDATQAIVKGYTTYRCEITDAYGEKIYSDECRLIRRLVFYTFPQDAYASAGEWAEFKPVHIGGKEPYTYKWQYINSNLSDWKDFPASGEGSWYNGGTADTLELLVYQSYLDTNWKVRCIVTDALGDTVTSPGASLYPGLYIADQSEDIYLSKGSSYTNVTISVTPGGGKAPYSYQWYRVANDTTLQLSTVQTITTQVHSSVIGVYRYYCVVTDSLGNTVTTEDIDVLEAMSFTTQPADVYADVGEWIQFQVAATGGKAPYTYKWQYISDYYDDAVDFTTGNNSWNSGRLTDTLSIKVYQSDIDEHWRYRCTVTDANGTSIVSDYASLYKAP